MPAATALTPFHPLIAEWFAARIGEPTAVQELAWPRIAAGASVLATAPTGSGKTLAAFLWAIDRLISGAWPIGRTSVIYVSPLKALNNDVQRNLLDPLAALRAHFAERGERMPEIRALVRSGDTPQAERQRMLRRPPEILITTPESLNLLLTSHHGRRALGEVRTVILDEIHAVAATKRGAWLMAAVERLRLVSGDFQRIALSATVRPLEAVAELVGGRLADGAPRPVEILRAPGRKQVDLRVHKAAALAREARGEDDFWPALARELKTIIAANRSTLFFCNSRRMSEKLARFLNEGEPEPIAWAHHGSLAREMRQLVEERLKRGELKALVATSSLELGIDVGALDEVVLIQCPRSLNACVQRLGRAGHQVGATSRGRVYPLHGRDLLESAVIAPLAVALEGEALSPIGNPLDVLAQLLVAMCGVETWEVERLYAFVRTIHAWRSLPRESFDSVVAMLLGRYEDGRIRELTPRLRLTPQAGGRDLLEAREGSLRLVWQSGGVIPDRGYFTIRVQGSGARIGELDEEFVWERHSGDEFSIGSQIWRVARITHNDVEVVPGKRSGAMAPFWRAEAEDRGWALAERIGEFLEHAQARLGEPGFVDELRERCLLEPEAALELSQWLQRQREATGAIPHRHLLIAERTVDPSAPDAELLALHAPWGGRVLRPLAMALTQAWHERFQGFPELVAGDDCLLVQVPRGMRAAEVLRLVPPERLDRLLRARLPATGFFGARFRENAARALLLPRPSRRERVPLWLTRLRAKKLLDAIAPHAEFPILVETWRTCLQDSFDLEPLRALLTEVEDGAIELREVTTERPSPFAEDVVWSSTNQHMYADDRPSGRTAATPGDRALAQVLRSPELRPRLATETIATLQGKLQRTQPGYAPSSADELVDLLDERVLIPLPEWRELLAACERDHGVAPGEIVGALGARAAELPSLSAIAPASGLPRLRRALDRELEARSLAGDAIVPKPSEAEPDEALAQCLAEFLRGYGPVEPDWLARTWALPAERCARIVDELIDDETLVDEVLVEGDERQRLCDAENLERLLRIARAARRPRLEPLPIAALPLFLADWQGLTRRGSDIDALQEALEKLFGLVAPAALWETDILPARVHPYLTSWLDSLMQTTDLMWFGLGRERVGFCFRETLPLFHAPEPDGELAALLPDPQARYDFFAVQKQSGLTSAETTARLWDLAWRGRIANDTFAALRQGVAHGFKATPAAAQASPRAGLRGWQTSRPLQGAWHRLVVEESADALDELERDKERVRQLLERYGVIFRELLGNEPPLLGWGRLLPAMRLMELSGELVAGSFFAGVPGLQFASAAAARRVGEPLTEDAVWWINAADPASCCGLKLEALKGALPARLPTTQLVFRGRALALAVRRAGRALDFAIAADDPALPKAIAPLREWLSRQAGPMKALAVEEINGEPALGSAYAPALQAVGFHRELKGLILRREW